MYLMNYNRCIKLLYVLNKFIGITVMSITVHYIFVFIYTSTCDDVSNIKFLSKFNIAITIIDYFKFTMIIILTDFVISLLTIFDLNLTSAIAIIQSLLLVIQILWIWFGQNLVSVETCYPYIKNILWIIYIAYEINSFVYTIMIIILSKLQKKIRNKISKKYLIDLDNECEKLEFNNNDATKPISPTPVKENKANTILLDI